MNTRSNPPSEPSRGKVQLNARISVELDEQMREYQNATGMKRQALIEHAIDEYLRRHGKPKRT